jgi:membrane protein YdbS with pleckstrin-like domain
MSPIGALITRYKLTTERLQADTGLLRRVLEEVELIRVKDIRLERGVLQRLFGSGTIEVITIDSTAPVLKLHDVAEPERLREAIRNAVADERQKRGRMMIVP